MRLYLRLAWRNLWRNRRRSVISIAAVVFAVITAVSMRSLQLGFYARAIANVVSVYTGYLQIHATGYQDKQSLDLSFVHPDSLSGVVEIVPGVTFSAPRLEAFALLSSGATTDATQIVGIDPARENRLTSLKDKIVAGRYLTPDDDGILLAEGLATHLGLAVGDTVVVLGSGYHGITAAGRFPIAGTLHFPTPELNAGIAYIALPRAQWLFGAADRATSLVVMLSGPRALTAVASRLQGGLGSAFEVVTWETMLPDMVQYIDLDNASGEVMLLLVYTIVGFGLLGTVLMMTVERTREFGMLLAVGMSRGRLSLMVVLESVLLSFAGAMSGMLISIPLLVYFHHHPLHMTGQAATALLNYGFEPIFPFSLDPAIFIWQTVTVLAIALATAAYPLVRVSRLNVVEARR